VPHPQSLAVSLFAEPIEKIAEVALAVLLPQYRAAPTHLAPLDFQPDPQAEPQAILWSPQASPEKCALIGNQGDGWYSLTNLVAKQLKSGVLNFRATAAEQYVCAFDYWLNGQRLRSVMALQDEPWMFRQGGKPLQEEDLQQYKARKIKDRVTPQSLANLATKLGWPVLEPHFWRPAGSARILMSTPATAKNAA